MLFALSVAMRMLSLRLGVVELWELGSSVLVPELGVARVFGLLAMLG